MPRMFRVGVSRCHPADAQQQTDMRSLQKEKALDVSSVEPLWWWSREQSRSSDEVSEALQRSRRDE